MQMSADLREIEAHLSCALADIAAENIDDMWCERVYGVLEYLGEDVLPALRSLQKPSEPVGIEGRVARLEEQIGHLRAEFHFPAESFTDRLKRCTWLRKQLLPAVVPLPDTSTETS